MTLEEVLRLLRDRQRLLDAGGFQGPSLIRLVEDAIRQAVAEERETILTRLRAFSVRVGTAAGTQEERLLAVTAAAALDAAIEEIRARGLIPGLDPEECRRGAEQIERGEVSPHAEVFDRVRARGGQTP